MDKQKERFLAEREEMCSLNLDELHVEKFSSQVECYIAIKLASENQEVNKCPRRSGG